MRTPSSNRKLHHTPAPPGLAKTAPAKSPAPVVSLPGRKNLPVKPEYQVFAKLLREAMHARKMNASDLARAIWGTTTDPRGYDVARNRDRVGAYLAGTGYPSRETLPKLCEAVGLDPNLVPLPTRSSAPREFSGTPDVTFTLMTEHPGICSMYIRKMMPVEIGMKIMELLNSFNAENIERMERGERIDRAGTFDADATVNAG